MKRVKTIITLISENVQDDFVFEEGSAEDYIKSVASGMADIVDPEQVDEIKVRLEVEPMTDD